jgi:hypothetical protein
MLNLGFLIGFVLLINARLSQSYANNTNTINYDKNRLTDEQRLLSYLLTNYDSSTRPVYNSSNRIVINFGLMLIQICDMVFLVHF